MKHTAILFLKHYYIFGRLSCFWMLTPTAFSNLFLY